MKASISLLLTLLALFASTTQKWKNCLSSVNGVCLICYRSHTLQGDKGCTDQLPSTDICNYYTVFSGGDQCISCKSGYSLYSIGPKFVCKAAAVPQNCVDAQSIASATPTCKFCLNSYPSYPDSKKCIPPSQQSGAIENCLWGAKAITKTVPTCGRCVEGYTLVQETGVCVKTTKPGCLVDNGAGENCLCDVFAGYSAQPDGSCQKSD